MIRLTTRKAEVLLLRMVFKETNFRALLIGLLSFATILFAEPHPTVTAIDVTGNRKIEKDAILNKIKTQVGDFVLETTIEEDIRSIFSLGYFDHIEVSEETQGKGVRLTYEVIEKPTIKSISFEGLDELSEDEAKEEIGIKAYEVLDIHKLNVAIEKLKKKYEEKGYFIADGNYELKTDAARNEVEVIFHIQENEKVQVKKIRIVGNKIIPDSDLMSVMVTKEGGPFSWLTDSGTYREAAFERDLASLGFYYGTLGYVRARFGKPEVTVSPDRKWITITFHVEEGEQYFVGDVDFRGELLYTREELLEGLQLIKGEVFNTDTLRRETLRYTEKYSDLGYAYANVVPQPNIHDDTRTVDVVFDVDKGHRVYIGKIRITGNTRTKDKVIRRQLRIVEGELFNGTKKRISRENVLRLGFFDSVDFHQTTSKEDPNVVDVEIQVKERSTGQLVVGAGYASGSAGFTAHAQLSQNNFLGNGQIASLSAEMRQGDSYYTASLSFTEPYVGFSDWSLGGELYHLQRKLLNSASRITFREIRTGSAVRLGHPVTAFTDLYLSYKLEHSYVPQWEIIDRSLIPPASVNGYASILGLKMVYDKRDDRFDPRNGLYWDLSGDFAGVGGDQKYFKTRGTVKYFHPIVWDFIFRSQVTAANVSQVGSDPVPINELFITGGITSLRGYRYLSVGPKARISTDESVLSADGRAIKGQDIVIGGHNELVGNFEIEFPLLKEAKIRGVIFMDVGNSFNGTFDSSPALLANTGWGIRWFTPIGPLRFEFGIPIVRPGAPEFNFTIGPPF